MQFCAVLDDIVDQTLAGTSDGNAFAALALIARERDQYAHRRQLDA